MKKLLILTSLYPNPQNPVRGTFVREQVKVLEYEYNVRIIAWEFPVAFSHEMWRDGDSQVDYYRFPALVNFFPSGKRKVLSRVLEKLRQLEGKAIETAEKRLESPALEELIQQALNDPSGSLPELSVSIPEN